MGQFDNAIGCWRRVQAAKPLDEEASKAISQLSVEQTVPKGGYREEMLDGSMKVADLESAVRASMNRSRKEVTDELAAKTVDTGREKALLDAIAAHPADVPNI